jgi:hypothetical protein
MLAVLADENLREQIVNGLRRRVPDLDLVTARDADLLGATDPEVLDWAAGESRVVLTQDLRTMKGFAYERVGRGQPMPGVLEIPDLMPIGRAVEEILLVLELVRESEIENRVLRLPL